MSPKKTEDSPEPEASGSVRLRLARAALEAALDVSGVLDADPGPGRLRVTADPPSGLLVGVSATALPDGRYGVDLSLIAELVSLPELANEVRERVLERARRDRVADFLGSINVEFPYVMTREEVAAAAAQEAERLVSEELGAAVLEAEAEAEARAAREASATAPTEAPDAVAVPRPTAAPAAEGQGAEPGGAASPPSAAVSAIAAQQAAIATDQAALAAKQAALAAEQAALVAGSEVVIRSSTGSAESIEPDGEGPGG
ncbi:MAG: hypothetical protein JO286_20500 [Solirubrobacterales bacterium]|nr:hypothetical protein [Solirubrobacterales bacterium]MBV9809576.1 hypothetical protein [Solirubrobacterales bacterium]